MHTSKIKTSPDPYTRHILDRWWLICDGFWNAGGIQIFWRLLMWIMLSWRKNGWSERWIWPLKCWLRKTPYEERIVKAEWPALSTAWQSPVAVFQSLAVWSKDADTICLPSGEKTAEVTLSECPFSTTRQPPVTVLQILAVLLSWGADTIHLPSGEKTVEMTQNKYSFSIAQQSSVAVLQILAVWSQDADTIHLPSGEKIAEMTLSECPFNTAWQSPVAVLQILAVWLSDADTIYLLLGEKTADTTLSECPSSTAWQSPVAAFHILEVWSLKVRVNLSSQSWSERQL